MSPPENDVPAREARFLAEAETFGLRFRCRDCAHAADGGRTCSLGLPNAQLRDVPGAFDSRGELAFCKYWEL